MVENKSKRSERIIKDKIKFCEDCGHSIADHLRDFKGGINCQTCERKGQICGWELE